MTKFYILFIFHSLGSVNQVAGEYITRSAEINIVDNTTADILQTAKNIKSTATTNIEQIAAKHYLENSTDNLLKLISDFMNAVKDGFMDVSALTVLSAAPGLPSTPPINVVKFTTTASSITAIAAKVDGMTK